MSNCAAGIQVIIDISNDINMKDKSMTPAKIRTILSLALARSLINTQADSALYGLLETTNVLMLKSERLKLL